MPHFFIKRIGVQVKLQCTCTIKNGSEGKKRYSRSDMSSEYGDQYNYKCRAVHACKLKYTMANNRNRIKRSEGMY